MIDYICCVPDSALVCQCFSKHQANRPRRPEYLAYERSGARGDVFWMQGDLPPRAPLFFLRSFKLV